MPLRSDTFTRRGLTAQALFSTFAVLPDAPGKTLATGLAEAWMRLDPKRERTGRQIRERLGLDPAAAAALTLANYRHYLLGIQEASRLPGLSADHLAKMVDGKAFCEEARQALDLGKGLIIASAHLGNWIWFSSYLHVKGLIDGHVINPFSDSGVDAAVTRLRTWHGLPLWNRTGVMHKAARVLKRGGSFSIMMDLDLGASGWMLPFLGAPASTNPVPVELAVRSGTPILLAALVRQPSGSPCPFAMVHEPLILPQTGDEAEARRILGHINDRISAMIIRYPDQWWWQNKRWRTKKTRPRKHGRPERNRLRQEKEDGV